MSRRSSAMKPVARIALRGDRAGIGDNHLGVRPRRSQPIGAIDNMLGEHGGHLAT